MSFDKNFCSSPWFHMRINNTGHYEYCRWIEKKDRQKGANIKEVDPVTWFRNGMQQIRLDLLANKPPDGCKQCHLMEKHGKVSGRQKQLLKTGVTVEDFGKSMLTSPWLEVYKQTNKGDTDNLSIQDYQIDLGNYCNSACVFCSPYSSSKLAVEFMKIGLIQDLPPKAWCDDETHLQTFLDALRASPSLAYIHFIGGETLITPAFDKILSVLIDKSLHTTTAIGFTTNLTVWNQNVVDKLCQFREVNLGMSIECITELNDYVRYPSRLEDCLEIMERWLALATEKNWFAQLRITPTVLSIWHIVSIYEFAMRHHLAVEACSFLNNPTFMRPSVLPAEMRQEVIRKLSHWIDQKFDQAQDQIINTRNPHTQHLQIVQDAKSYVNYLNTQPDESWRLPDLVQFLKRLESSRKNSILEYLPEYEQLLRSAGY